MAQILAYPAHGSQCAGQTMASANRNTENRYTEGNKMTALYTIVFAYSCALAATYAAIAIWSYVAPLTITEA